jgi:pimeloyl-ACP methyl ester carboxylesterase
MPYADHQGTRIHYQVEGDGPALVLQHGFTGNLKAVVLVRLCWRAQIELSTHPRGRARTWGKRQTT